MGLLLVLCCVVTRMRYRVQCRKPAGRKLCSPANCDVGEYLSTLGVWAVHACIPSVHACLCCAVVQRLCACRDLERDSGAA